MLIYRIIIVLTLLFIMHPTPPVHCQEPGLTQKIQVVRGKVREVNWVAGKLVVKTNDFGQTDDITFLVPDNTKITKGTSTISLGNINISSWVTVEFYSTLSGLRAVHITVN